MAPDPGPPLGTGVRGEISLLDQIAHNSLDDYSSVDEPRPWRRSVLASWRTAFVLCLVGALIALAASQTFFERPIMQEQRSVLISNLEERNEDLTDAQQELRDLSTEISELRTLAEQRDGRRDAAALIGTQQVEGPGLSVVLDHGSDRVSVFDLQRTVNGLWGAGAEAIAVNDQRLTGLSAVRTANNAIIVNYISISAPFVVTAIGDPEELTDRFALVDGGHHLRRRAEEGIEVDQRSHSAVTLPPAPGHRVTLEHAALIAADDEEAP